MFWWNLLHCCLHLMVRWHCLRENSLAEPERMTEVSLVIRFCPSTWQLRPGRTKGRPKTHFKAALIPLTHLNNTVEQMFLINCFSGIIIYNFHTLWTWKLMHIMLQYKSRGVHCFNCSLICGQWFSVCLYCLWEL